jgi:hypothetical protein
MRSYYFGYRQHRGHGLQRPDLSTDYEFIYTNPWGVSLDGRLCPKTEEDEQQGHALLHHKDGWTCIAFWDRSGDYRRGSNSAFLMEGTHTFDEMLKLSYEHFPKIFQRFGFPIIDVTPKG